MSFGFSVGDFAVFTKFATKVVKALRDEGGSKIEYQIAERQCEEFLSAASELNSLDLSQLPESFRERLIASTANFSSIIKQFRKTIESYERSLGEKSQRGTFFSAPKKVQWALLAAEDLASVRQALTAQVSLIHLAIETNLL
ncbi:hypothetical protein UCREL1_6927 [Eutypa lata UCREL1]|uniref:Uncharacterized protein n=1 Tax=Eutypa lata (strain UCR-EL1) TaxID=1287681 RepID=M7THA1_EUTLA|nr:hypothetical protein UCREL1_6927 [Eutypa lata UCREL1]